MQKGWVPAPESVSELVSPSLSSLSSSSSHTGAGGKSFP